MRKSAAVLAGVAFVLISAPASIADHSTDTYNCSDFTYEEDAQEHFSQHPGDPDRLDGDNDGRPCEDLPSRMAPVAPFPGAPPPQAAVAPQPAPALPPPPVAPQPAPAPTPTAAPPEPPAPGLPSGPAAPDAGGGAPGGDSAGFDGSGGSASGPTATDAVGPPAEGSLPAVLSPSPPVSAPVAAPEFVAPQPAVQSPTLVSAPAAAQGPALSRDTHTTPGTGRALARTGVALTVAGVAGLCFIGAGRALVTHSRRRPRWPCRRR